MSATRNYVTESGLIRTSYAMICLTTVFVLARFITTRMVQSKRWTVQDTLVYLSYVLFLVMAILYIVVTPKLFRLTAFAEGRIALYADVVDDNMAVLQIFFVNGMMLWFVLWTVKFSFLMLYKKLMEGLHNIYIQLWRATLIFCILSLIGAVVSHFTSCSSMRAWFTPGQCATPRDAKSQIASLYYTYAVDVLSDLMIMGLPIQLIWNLQMPLSSKIGLMALFGSGFVLIAAATLRVVQIGTKAQNSTPSSTWLALWGIIECSIAVIIGCGPSFASLIRSRTSRHVSYDTQGFVRQRGDNEEVDGVDGVRMKTYAKVTHGAVLEEEKVHGKKEDEEEEFDDQDGDQLEIVEQNRGTKKSNIQLRQGRGRRSMGTRAPHEEV